jgi:hypothetical protein
MRSAICVPDRKRSEQIVRETREKDAKEDRKRRGLDRISRIHRIL